MGPHQSKEVQQLDIAISHPKFQQAKILNDGSSRLLVTTIATNQEQYKKWKEHLKNLKGGDESLLLPVRDQFSTSGLCGTAGTLKIFYDSFSYLLTEEMHNRKGRKARFSEQELWSLLLNLIEAKSAMRSNGMVVGDIRPENIFLNEEGKIKVSNLLSWPSEISNFQKAFDKKITYLSPEQIHTLQMGGIDEEQAEPSQIFSIGLTLLSACLLTNFDYFYDLSKEPSFNAGAFQQRITEFKSAKYSEVFRGVILNLCSIQPQRRLTLDQLIGLLQKHIQSIQNKENFLIDNAPQKLHQEIMRLREYLASIAPPVLHTPQVIPFSQASNPFTGNNYVSDSFKNHIQSEIDKKIDEQKGAQKVEQKAKNGSVVDELKKEVANPNPKQIPIKSINTVQKIQSEPEVKSATKN